MVQASASPSLTKFRLACAPLISWNRSGAAMDWLASLALVLLVMAPTMSRFWIAMRSPPSSRNWLSRSRYIFCTLVHRGMSLSLSVICPVRAASTAGGVE